MNNKNKGFTIIELMISVAIISILVALASPNFSGFVKNNKITTWINILIGIINIGLLIWQVLKN